MGAATLGRVDLGHPLRSIVPSLDAEVLTVLARVEDGLGLSQITRLAARGSRMGIAHVVDRLVEHGIVIAEPTNHGSTYRLAREHVLVPIVVAAVEARADVLSRLGSAVARLDPEPLHASVFGSFARGEAGPTSDIDVLLVAGSDDELDSWDAPVPDLVADVERWTGNRCQVFAITEDRVRALQRAGEAIVTEWLTDGLRLGGVDLETLLSG